MSLYKNFPVDLPKRIIELDPGFRRIASDGGLEVTYLLMKLSAAFLLPYERLAGTSGARGGETLERQLIRKPLELDKRFLMSSYVAAPQDWLLLHTDDYPMGPTRWKSETQQLDHEVHFVLKIIRHAVAHSNLFFGGESKIQHIYLASRREERRDTTKYRVIRSTVAELDNLVNGWLQNVQGLRVSPSEIWSAIDEAA